MIATDEGVIPRDWSVERGRAFYGMVYLCYNNRFTTLAY